MVASRIRRVARRALNGSEDDDLVQLVRELELAGRVTFRPERWRPGMVLGHHSPNETMGPVQWLARRKAKGTCPGWPDLDFTDPVAGRRVLELKRPDGEASENQRIVLAALAMAGAETALCRGIDAARAQLRAWGYLP